MSKILTVKEIQLKYLNKYGSGDIDAMLTEFAKIHVEEAKKQFKIVFSEIDNPYPFEYNDPLEDVYPLTNIK